MSESKDLARRFSTPARPVQAIGNEFLERSPLTDEIFFHRKTELRFQDALARALENGIKRDPAIAKAAFEVGVTVDWAIKYLDSPRYKRWSEDRFKEICINHGMTQEWFLAQQFEIYSGKLNKTDLQMRALEAIGKRIAPEVTKMDLKVEKAEPVSMDELLKAQAEVDALEQKLKQAILPIEAKVVEG